MDKPDDATGGKSSHTGTAEQKQVGVVVVVVVVVVINNYIVDQDHLKQV